MINHYEYSIMKKSFIVSELWKQAFKEYNDEALVNGDRTLSMNCRPCWFKVLMWHKKRLNISDQITRTCKA